LLHQKTGRVETIDGTLRRLLEDMVETMHAAPGVGLAANQVGVPLQVAVIDLSMQEEPVRRHPLLVIINPEILSLEGAIIEEEGCLSIPEYSEK
jgi:peptide deformylase